MDFILFCLNVVYDNGNDRGRTVDRNDKDGRISCINVAE